jgi:hypothetical protein
MEFTIRVLIAIVLLVIVFVVLVALIGGWGGDIGAMLKGLSEWFNQILAGKVKPPTGGNLPGIIPSSTGK